MKFIHIADIHANKERFLQIKKILETLIEKCESDPLIEYVLISGDFWDSTITNTAASGFNEMVRLVNKLNQIAHVIMIYGTPSHEPEGSLDIFEECGCTVFSKISSMNFPGLSILAIPEPRRSLFIGKNETESTEKIKHYLDSVFDLKYDTSQPLVVMYHGEIMGAKYQNGVEASSPIAVSKTYLEKLRASYYACGHIHAPQEVFKNCLYSGSAAAIDMGETHDASYNLVTVNKDCETVVEKISFGFPVNKNVEVTMDSFESLVTQDFTNVNLKVKLTTTERCNPKPLIDKLKAFTNANSVKISFILPSNINIRSKEIISQKSVCDKLLTYGKVNGIKISESCMKKMHELEDSMLIKYSFPSHSFELISLSLKGAIGLMGREEIFIDFSKYRDGVIVFAGENGKGKTTILENCHPFPQMLTRGGKLRDHFYLRDSHRILVYRDETGLYYRVTIAMAADIKNGVTKYYVETGDGECWSPVPECDGNLDSYNKYIEETFGSVDIFLKTSFFAKEQTKGYPDIATATKGERMNLFAKLAGTDYYSTLCKSAKEYESSLNSKIEVQELAISKKEDLVANLEKYKTQEKEARDLCDKLDPVIFTLKEKYNSLVEKDKEYQAYLQKAESLRLTAEEFQKSINRNNELIDEIKKDLENIEKFKILENDIAAYQQLKDRLDEINRKYKEKTEAADKVKEEIASYKSIIDNDYAFIVEEKLILTSSESKISFLEEQLSSKEIKDFCPTCGAKISKEKEKELNLALDSLKSDLELVKKSKNEIEKTIKELNNKIDSNNKIIEELNIKLSSIISERDKELSDTTLLENSIKSLKEKGVDKLTNFSPRFSNHQEKIEKLLAENDKLELKIKGQVVKDIPENVSSEFQKISQDLDDAKRSHSELVGKIKGCKTVIEAFEKELKDIKSAEKSIAADRKDLEEYKFLAKALSNSGIQALELEAIVPDISRITNSLLEQSYGTKLTVSFETLRQGAKSLVEDFNIMVTNSENGRTYPIAMLSSGELVWVKQALFHAFSIIRSEGTGFSFKTRFMDECDGSLDSSMRLKYLKMINAAHSEGNANKTVLISHSLEIISSADQIFNL